MGKAAIFPVLIMAILFCSGCVHKKKLYTSDCSGSTAFKQVAYKNLVDSIRFYDKQYVEVSGKYAEGKNISALVNDSLFTSRESGQGLWVNFTQDCPLYLKGTHRGIFASEDGSNSHLNGRMVTIRGQIDVKVKGHQKAYSATINNVSYIKIY
jgi:hypothetical protein